MGNSHLQQFPDDHLQLRNPPSPKLVVSGTMSQSKTGSPKSSKSSDDNSKSDGSSTPPKTVRSPSSTKSSPGSNKSLSLAERLAQSTRGKSNSTLKSPVSKSSPTSSNASTSSKTAISKESPEESSESLKSDDTENINTCNGSEGIKIENTQISDEQDVTIVENGKNELNDGELKDGGEESNKTESEEDNFSDAKENTIPQNDLNVVVVNEDLQNSNKPQRIEDSIILDLKSKKDIRQKIWEFMEENLLVVFPKPCFNRIPNFKGCNVTTLMLEKLEEFKKAKTIQVTPDKAQETARFLTLSWGKRLLVPLLRLKEGLLQNVSLPFAEPSAKLLRSASTQKGLRKWGNKLITSDNNTDSYHIDMIILGSVAVDRKGHRIGIGNGFCDLEYVILRSMNMVTDNTVVVTIVHDAQVFDTLPVEVFKPYDVPVDIIITSNEIIRVENCFDRPKDIFWNYISKRRLLEMPPLQLLRTKQEKDNEFDCTLKEVDSEPEEIPPSPKTFKRNKGYRHRRSFSARSETNDSVFKDPVVSKRRSSKHTAPISKNSDSKGKQNRAKSTSSQQHRSTSSDKQTNQNDKKEHRSSSKKPNKRRTKSESAKTAVLPVIITESKISNDTQGDSPSNDTPKNKRRSRQKPRQRKNSDDIDKESVHQSHPKSNGNINHNSRSNSRATRRDYIDRPDYGRDMSIGRNSRKEYFFNSRNYYVKNHHNSYSQERSSHSNVRSNSRNQRHDSNRSTGMQINRYSNTAPHVRQTRYFNGPKVHHNNFNGPVLHQNNNNNYHLMRHNSYSSDSMSRQNNFYDGIISHRNNFSKGSAVRQDGYTNSRVFRPPHYRNGIDSPNNEREYVRESRPRFNNNRPGYFDSNEKPSYTRSISDDDFVLKVGNIANNVRVRDLKAALMERGVKPLHITWRGPRGFAYLRYSNAVDNKDNIMGTLQNVRIKPNGVETAQTQTLIVTEFS